MKCPVGIDGKCCQLKQEILLFFCIDRVSWVLLLAQLCHQCLHIPGCIALELRPRPMLLCITTVAYSYYFVGQNMALGDKNTLLPCTLPNQRRRLEIQTGIANSSSWQLRPSLWLYPVTSLNAGGTTDFRLCLEGNTRPAKSPTRLIV